MNKLWHQKIKQASGQISTIPCGCKEYVVGEIKIKANTARLEQELELSLAKSILTSVH